MGLILYGTWANRPLGFAGKVFARNPVSNARNWTNGNFISVPVGYHNGALILPISGGGIACYINGSSNLLATIDGIGILASNLAGSSTFTANGALGRNLECTMQGNGAVTASIDAKGWLTCTIQIGAQPSAFDIAQAVLNAVASQYNVPGTIGEAIQSGGGGGGGGLTTEEHNKLMKSLTKTDFIALK